MDSINMVVKTVGNAEPFLNVLRITALTSYTSCKAIAFTTVEDKATNLSVGVGVATSTTDFINRLQELYLNVPEGTEFTVGTIDKTGDVYVKDIQFESGVSLGNSQKGDDLLLKVAPSSKVTIKILFRNTFSFVNLIDNQAFAEDQLGTEYSIVAFTSNHCPITSFAYKKKNDTEYAVSIQALYSISFEDLKSRVVKIFTEMSASQ